MFFSVLFTIARIWRQPRCPPVDEGIKEVVVQIYNAILLSYKKEHVWVSSNEVDEPRAYYTEWSQSERERHIPYIHAHTWNLERWYWQSYVQGSKGNTDVKNRLLDSVGEGEGGIIWENSIEILPYVNMVLHKYYHM